MNVKETEELDIDLRILVEAHTRATLKSEPSQADANMVVILRGIVLLSLQLAELTKKKAATET